MASAVSPFCLWVAIRGYKWLATLMKRVPQALRYHLPAIHLLPSGPRDCLFPQPSISVGPGFDPETAHHLYHWLYLFLDFSTMSARRSPRI